MTRALCLAFSLPAVLILASCDLPPPPPTEVAAAPAVSTAPKKHHHCEYMTGSRLCQDTDEQSEESSTGLAGPAVDTRGLGRSGGS